VPEGSRTVLAVLPSGGVSACRPAARHTIEFKDNGVFDFRRLGV
jgi:hypothetical protein